MDTTLILQRLNSLDDKRQNGSPAARENMLVAAQALVTSLQTPSEFISSIGWAEPARSACMRTALDLKLFEVLDEHPDDGISVKKLARATGADQELAARILRHLAAMNVIAEQSPGKFTNTSLSRRLIEPKYRDGILYCYDVAGPAFRRIPDYLSKTQHKQPLNPVDGPFQYAHATDKHFFTWLMEHPTYASAFANYMGGYRQGKTPWFASDFYPVQKNLIDGFSASENGAAFLVDVGGGKGHDLLALKSTYPSLTGKLVLQDKPDVIASIDPPLPSSITAMAHDFFQPQPIRGARTYFLHSVLHDWDDDGCIKILSALRSAMTPAFSKILVHDLIVPDTQATWGVTSMDWLMMVLGAVRERTEADFRKLFAAAGLVVERVWIYEQATEGVIEAVLP